jgi:hypothetical protein
MTADAKTLAAVTAALLERGRTINGFSIALIIGAILAIALRILEPIALALSILAGLAQVYLALRVAFDAALFRLLAGQPDLDALDAALTELRLLPAAKAGRPLGPRIAGARRLFVAQIAAAALQLLLILIGTAVRS